MRIARTIDELSGSRHGTLVPTMGALHEGHLALIRRATRLPRPVVVSLFVNPTQFGPDEDLDRYPRHFEDDVAAAAAAGAEVLFAPAVETVYPPGIETEVVPLPEVATRPGLEDARRPGHFAGVCQVVARLLDLTRPTRAVFGEKDYQQLLVIEAMVRGAGDRWPGLAIERHPTVREPDGLAMSSRNANLEPPERDRALALFRGLEAAANASGPEEAERAMNRLLGAARIDVEYAVVRCAETLMPVSAPTCPARALMAARLGTVRLIDNRALGRVGRTVVRIRVAALVPLLLLAALATGCVHRTPADPDRIRLHLGAAPPDVGAWPSRDPQAVLDFTREIGVPVVPGGTTPGMLNFSGEAERLYRNDEMMLQFAVCRGVYGQGVVYENVLGGNRAQSLHHVIVNDLDRARLDEALASPEPPTDEDRRVTRWTAAVSMPPRDLPRGLVVHSVSSDRRWHEQSVIEALLRRGWAVLTVIPHGFTISFTIGPEPEADEARRPGALIEPDEFAATLEHYLVDSAYAVESILGYLAEHRRDVPQDPLVLVGFSLGALGTPTVAARLEDRTDAVVLVGGGVNLAAVALESDLFQPAVRALRRHAGPDAVETIRSYPETYLGRTRFDPYHTAPGLAGTPVLLLHASYDRIVPAETGDLLYERLARPERWSYPLGHFGLFLSLPSQAEEIADWIDRTVPEKR